MRKKEEDWCKIDYVCLLIFKLMSISGLLGINSDYCFRTLHVENSALSPYMTLGFNSGGSDKSIVVLYNSVTETPLYQKEVGALSKSSLSTTALAEEYKELMLYWAS